jgi:hypothetical protein
MLLRPFIPLENTLFIHNTVLCASEVIAHVSLALFPNFIQNLMFLSPNSDYSFSDGRYTHLLYLPPLQNNSAVVLKSQLAAAAAAAAAAVVVVVLYLVMDSIVALLTLGIKCDITRQYAL